MDALKRLGWRVWLALGIVYVLWGSTYVGIKAAVATLPPFASGGGRFLIAGLALSLFALFRGAAWPTLRELRGPAVTGLLLVTGGNGAVMLAEQRLEAGPTALLAGLSPVLMAVMTAIAFRQRIGRMVVVGLVIGLGGVALLVLPTGGGGRYSLVGAAIALCGSILWAAGAAYGTRSPAPASAALTSGLQMVAGSLGLLVLALGAGELRPAAFAHASTESVVAITYLAVFGSIVGFSCFSWLLRRAPLSLVSTHSYVNPVVAVALGAVLLGERVDLRELMAGAVIVTGVALIVSFQPRQARVPAAPAAPPEVARASQT